MSDLTRAPPLSLLERTRDPATLSEDELKLLGAWLGENLLRPRRNAGVLYVRDLGGKLKPASVGVKLAAAKAFYAALRWSGATDTAPFTDVRAAVDKTPSWEKRDAYTRTEVHWLERTSESYTLYNQWC